MNRCLLLALALGPGCLVNRALYDELAGNFASGGDDDDDDDDDCTPAAEVCNGADDDCDGAVDDDDLDLDPTSASSFYPDADRDGFGDAASPVTACEPPADHVTDATDCDDADAGSFPGGDEICGDGIDQDCNGASLSCFEGGTLDLPTAAFATYTSPGTFFSVAAAGDVDGDAAPDLLVGMSVDSTIGPRHAGAVHLVTGDVAGDQGVAAVAFATVYGTQEDDSLGFAVSPAGDVNADGFADIVITGGNFFTRNGVVLLFLGPLSGPVADDQADARFDSTPTFTGLWVGGGGDVNADGVPDLLIGEDAGTVYVVSGSERGIQDLGEAASIEIHTESFGGPQASMVGDVDGDGLTDLLVGCRHTSDPAGALGSPGVAYLVVAGAGVVIDALQDADATLVGESDLAYAGDAVTGAGDIDGDGLPDLLIGAEDEDGAGFDVGAAYLFSGIVRGVRSLGDAPARLYGEDDADHAGSSVAGGADIDGDGATDLLVGAEGVDLGGSLSGATYVFLGPLSGTETLAEADATLLGLPEEMVGAGTVLTDLDGDGLADPVIRGNPFPGGVVYAVSGGSL